MRVNPSEDISWAVERFKVIQHEQRRSRGTVGKASLKVSIWLKSRLMTFARFKKFNRRPSDILLSDDTGTDRLRARFKKINVSSAQPDDYFVGWRIEFGY
jgi:hypothetical protein